MGLARWLLTGGLLWQGGVMYRQSLERKVKYEAARAYANSMGKPLLVVGGPYGSNPLRHIFLTPAHGYGDVCLDIDPEACMNCPKGCKVEVADVRDIPYPDGYFASALVSHCLEHLDTVADCQQAWVELHRVSDAVFVAGPSKSSLLAWLIPDHHLWVEQQADGSLRVEQR